MFLCSCKWSWWTGDETIRGVSRNGHQCAEIEGTIRPPSRAVKETPTTNNIVPEYTLCAIEFFGVIVLELYIVQLIIWLPQDHIMIIACILYKIDKSTLSALDKLLIIIRHLYLSNVKVKFGSQKEHHKDMYLEKKVNYMLSNSPNPKY